MKDWKTTIAGVGAILTALGGMLTQLVNGNLFTGTNLQNDIAAIIVGAGLIYASDKR